MVLNVRIAEAAGSSAAPPAQEPTTGEARKAYRRALRDLAAGLAEQRRIALASA